MTAENVALARGYFDAVARGDMAALTGMFSDDLVWHQPGKSSVSGTYKGRDAVFGLLGSFMERSQGSFRIDDVGQILANADYVATTLHFEAKAGEKSMSMSGIDVLRIEAGKIREVWLFSQDQPAEDAFWG